MSANQKPTLDSLKPGDMVAVYSYARLSRQQVKRCTATRITVGEVQYTRKGLRVGSPRPSWGGYSEWIEPWDDEKHPKLIAELRAEHRLYKSRKLLADFAWNKVTQAQADAVLAAMQSAGLLKKSE